jgi:hypothetical protein
VSRTPRALVVTLALATAPLLGGECAPGALVAAAEPASERVAPAKVVADVDAGAGAGAEAGQFVPAPDEGDPLLAFDWLDTLTGLIVDVGPGVPLILAGPDGKLDSEDDEILLDVVGDIDLVVRSGISDFSGAIPDPSPLVAGGSVPEGIAEPFALGTPIDFVVVASDGATSPPYGNPAAPAYFEGLPILVLAFADLDGDGFIGITSLDGDPGDSQLEEAELTPVGRRFVIGAGDRAAGQLFVEAGGPAGARVEIALTAATWAGPRDASFLSGDVPAVTTHLPLVASTDPSDILGGGAGGPPLPTSTDDLVGVKVREVLRPDPSQPYGEAFTLRLDGSDPTIDVATMSAGAFERFGVVRTPDRLRFASLESRPLRLGLDDLGQPAPYEVIGGLTVHDDGVSSAETVRIVPMDRLGNVTDWDAAPELVTLRTGGKVRITAPDSDGDPFHETVVVADARGVEVRLDDAGGQFDDDNADFLRVEGAGGLMRVDLHLPDPDVDDSGVVDAIDVALVAAAEEFRLSRASFDLDGDGRVRGEDVSLVARQRGRVVRVP